MVCSAERSIALEIAIGSIALASRAGHISASVYTQTTDVELECDGFLNYDRTSKFSAEGTAKIKAANEALVEAGRAAWAKEHSSRL